MTQIDRNSGSRSVAETVQFAFDQLTPTERKAARFLSAQYPVAGLDTLTGFAKRAGVSGASILRMVSKLGFAGYPEFQKALRAELAAQLESPLIRRRERPTGQTKAEDFLDRFAERTAENIQQSLASVPRREFEAIAALLCDPGRSIYLLGGRITSSIAEYLALHLRAIRSHVYEIKGSNAAWLDQMLNIGKRDIVLLFDIRRYESDLLRFAEQVSRRGAVVILMTDEWLSPISQTAHHILPAKIATASSWDSGASILVYCEALIAAVSDRLGDSFTDRMAELEILRDALDQQKKPS